MKFNEKQNYQDQSYIFYFLNFHRTYCINENPILLLRPLRLFLFTEAPAAKSYTVSTFLFKGLITIYTSIVD